MSNFGNPNHSPDDGKFIAFWTDERIEQLKILLRQKYDNKKLADEFGVSIASIKSAMQRQHLMSEYNKDMSWTPEKVEELKSKLRANWTTKQIGEHFGRSRGAISGAIDRYGLAGLRPRSGNNNPLRGLAKNITPARKTPRKSTEPRKSAGPRRFSLDELLAGISSELRDLSSDQSPFAVTVSDFDQRHHCHWPLGDPRSDDFRFCGDTRHTGPYCIRHHARAYRRVSI